jgi:hypothetical protein
VLLFSGGFGFFSFDEQDSVFIEFAIYKFLSVCQTSTIFCLEGQIANIIILKEPFKIIMYLDGPDYVTETYIQYGSNMHQNSHLFDAGSSLFWPHLRKWENAYILTYVTFFISSDMVKGKASSGTSPFRHIPMSS